MADLIKLTCTSCGGKLELSHDIDQFVCAHCGTELIVKRSHGVIALKAVAQDIEGIKSSTDKTASELAIVRLKGEVFTLEQDKHAIVISVCGQKDLWKAYNLFRKKVSHSGPKKINSFEAAGEIQRLSSQEVVQFSEFLASQHPRFWDVHFAVGKLVTVNTELDRKSQELAVHQRQVSMS